MDGRFAGFLNFGYTTLGKYGVKEVILIGENFPVNKFNAQIIALAHDKAGEKDDILIAARENSIYYEPNIARLDRTLHSERLRRIYLLLRKKLRRGFIYRR